MRAVVPHGCGGGPEKLKFEEIVPDPQISGKPVLIAAAPRAIQSTGKPVQGRGRRIFHWRFMRSQAAT
jgi:hypothetical protein